MTAQVGDDKMSDNHKRKGAADGTSKKPQNTSTSTNDNDVDDMDNASSSGDETTSEQVRVTFRLSSDCKDDGTLQVPAQPIAVPADITRKGLQAVINHLLDRKIDNTKPDDDEDDDSDSDDDRLPGLAFDFMIDTAGNNKGQNQQQQRLLRTGIEREARRYGLSLENAIPIIYFPSQGAPEKKDDSEPLPDWIGCMSFVPTNNNTDNILINGCYDGSIHIMQQQHEKTSSNSVGTDSGLNIVASSSTAHSGPIKCLSASYSSDMVWITSGSMDHSLVVHQFDPDTQQLKQYANCTNGHYSAIGCVDLFVPKNNDSIDTKLLLASADWDGGLCIWDLSKSSATSSIGDDNHGDNEEKSSKKSKSNSLTSHRPTESVPQLSPITSIQAHASQVSGVSWGNYEKSNGGSQSQRQLITGSWDHSLKVWDIEQQDCILTLNGSRVISCLDTSYHTPNVVVTGHPDCTVRLWDTRVASNNNDAKESSSSVLQQVVSDNIFRPSHKGWISSVQWSKHNPYHLASTSHDGTIKLWDIRSSLPLHTVKAFPSTTTTTPNGNKKKMIHKGMSLAYGDINSGMIFAGGTDCIVHQFRFTSPKEQ